MDLQQVLHDLWLPLPTCPASPGMLWRI